MSLKTGGPANFKPRPIEGAPVAARSVSPQSLLLDGQQRMTSLYQVTLRNQVVETVTGDRGLRCRGRSEVRPKRHGGERLTPIVHQICKSSQGLGSFGRSDEAKI
jgi:hypothetical protein